MLIESITSLYLINLIREDYNKSRYTIILLVAFIISK
jgi:hypothetical protein